MTVGIDEVGRGSWAGPLLVVAARAHTQLPMTLADSKALSRRIREKLFYDIQIACDIGEGWVESNEIDRLGLSRAMKLGVKRALHALNATFEQAIIIDGPVNYCSTAFKNVKTLINADAIEPIVMAASIWAKVRRDQFMTAAAVKYPEYGFEQHVGYGTKMHRELLTLYGACDLHRLSYKPIKALQLL